MNEMRAVLDFWFPEGAGSDPETHKQYWMYRMRGGADAAIIERFAETTERAIGGELDDWAATSRGRLALVVCLDQFPRSLWRDDARAYASDPRALELALEGLDNGHYDALETPWEKSFFQMPLAHCEGPDLLERLDRVIELARSLVGEVAAELRPIYEFSAEQPVRHRSVISAFGRYPHRNKALGRASTPAELAYLAKGELPHLRKFDV